ncbi:hypothetical protein SPWS13_4048 [Shewanella putrefaciens]|nr:hypothetical protein SPWS13_4048 [Shewanella putrefaciens]
MFVEQLISDFITNFLSKCWRCLSYPWDIPVSSAANNGCVNMVNVF